MENPLYKFDLHLRDLSPQSAGTRAPVLINQHILVRAQSLPIYMISWQYKRLSRISSKLLLYCKFFFSPEGAACVCRWKFALKRKLFLFWFDSLKWSGFLYLCGGDSCPIRSLCILHVGPLQDSRRLARVQRLDRCRPLSWRSAR